MTDEQIITALKIHSNDKFDNCEGCPYLQGDSCEGFTKYSKPFRDILDLINRQKAEIEMLRAENETMLDTIHNLGDDYAKALEKGSEPND